MAIFFKTPKYKRFDYNPMYWDPDKEDLENRIAAAQNEGKEDIEASKSRISNGLKRRSGFNSSNVDLKYRQQAVRKSNLKLVGYIVILCVAAYYLILEFLPKILMLVEGSS